MKDNTKRSKCDDIRADNYDIREQTKYFLKLKSLYINLIKPLSSKKESLTKNYKQNFVKEELKKLLIYKRY